MFGRKKEFNYFICYAYKEKSKLYDGTFTLGWQPFTRIGNEITEEDIRDIMDAIKEDYDAEEVMIYSITRIGHERR